MFLLKTKLPLSLVLAFGGGQLFASTQLSILPPEDLSNNFNALVRETRPSWWGSWNLDPVIKPGAIGLIDTNTGTFRPAGQEITNILIESDSISQEMKLSTSDVKGPQLASFSMNMQSPEVDMSTSLKWQFSKRGAMLAQWSLVEERGLKDPFRVIHENMDLLRSTAENMNMYDAATGGISQGFGVVTSVILAKSGMNVASLSDSAQWSISGKAKSLESMFGRGDAQASYSSIEEDKNVMSVVWPNEANNSTQDLVPVAYTFASLDGDLVIPYWIGEINSFHITFQNSGSYYVKATLKYMSPKGSSELHQDIIGFSTRSIVNIPLDATALELKLEFIGAIPSATYSYSWDTPLGSWVTGKRHIDIDGLWPDQPTFNIRENQDDTFFRSQPLESEPFSHPD